MPRRFAYKELVAATNGFADDRRLGEGGYGRVYRGFLSDSVRVVAVKRIFSDVEEVYELVLFGFGSLIFNLFLEITCGTNDRLKLILH